MKVFKKMLVLLLSSLVMLCPFAAFAEEDAWSYENSVIVAVKRESIEKGKIYTPADFPEVDVSRVMVYTKGSAVLDLLLILDTSGENTVAEAIEKLSNNPVVEWVGENYCLPFQSTAVLNESNVTIKVGEKLTLKCVDSHLFRTDERPSGSICVQLAEDKFDPNKDYTVADFSAYDIKNVYQKEKGENYFVFLLKEDDYFYTCNIIDAAGKDPLFQSVYFEIRETGRRPVYQWSVADESVVQFNFDVNDDGIQYGYKDMELTALKEGSATVTLQLGYPGESQAVTTCEIKVLPNPNVSSDDTSKADISNVSIEDISENIHQSIDMSVSTDTDISSHQITSGIVENPKTGGSGIAGGLMLAIFTANAALFCYKKNK